MNDTPPPFLKAGDAPGTLQMAASENSTINIRPHLFSTYSKVSKKLTLRVHIRGQEILSF